ncbi:MAG: hypothetical protein B6245_17635 [Desulfobacteraceae bacterium 4572_88]|nr:MAG: hypothetical protein B6245_17635 [Desulfobacteraceae bacterium 4572_88]
MDNLNIQQTENSLAVSFNATSGVMRVEGVSYPEDPMVFFVSLKTWLRDYMAKIRGPLTLDLKLDYLNSSSTKCLLDFIETLEDYHNNGADVKINWYYDEDDDNIEEMGEDLAEDLSVPFNLIVC